MWQEGTGLNRSRESVGSRLNAHDQRSAAGPGPGPCSLRTVQAPPTTHLAAAMPFGRVSDGEAGAGRQRRGGTDSARWWCAQRGEQHGFISLSHPLGQGSSAASDHC